jgi:molybdate transport system substrate-binding protein
MAELGRVGTRAAPWRSPDCGQSRLALSECARRSRSAAQPAVSGTDSAVISLQDALDELGHACEQSHSGARVSFNYGGSGTLQFEIKQGAPVDVFISAAQNQTDALEPKGLIDAKTRRNIVSTEFVLVVPASSTIVRNFQDQARPKIKVDSWGEPGTVPAGIYARRTLASRAACRREEDRVCPR